MPHRYRVTICDDGDGILGDGIGALNIVTSSRCMSAANIHRRKPISLAERKLLTGTVKSAFVTFSESNKGANSLTLVKIAAKE